MACAIKPAFACSESGKKDFDLDSKLLNQCGALAQKIANKISHVIHPSLGKGELAETRPSSPLKDGGLDLHKGKIEYHISEALEKTNHEDRKVTIPVTMSTKKGAWECLYCVQFKIYNNKCSFEQISKHHCAGGVSYPSK